MLLTSGFQAAGRADLVLALAAAGAVLLLVLVWALASWGVLGVAAAFTLRGWLFWPVRLGLARRVLGLAIAPVLAPLAPSSWPGRRCSGPRSRCVG